MIGNSVKRKTLRIHPDVWFQKARFLDAFFKNVKKMGFTSFCYVVYYAQLPFGG